MKEKGEKMLNLMFLGERRISKGCIDVLQEKEFLKNFNLRVIVTNEQFFDGLIKAIKQNDEIKFISNAKRNTDLLLQAIKENSIDVLISVQHIWILPKSVLNAVDFKAFNLHNAKLPEYKGYNSISHAIINGEDEFFSTIHWMDAKVDSGDIIIEKKNKIYQNDTALSLYKKTIESSVVTFRKLLRFIIHDDIPRKNISQGGYFYGKNDLDSLKFLQLNDHPDHISRIVRASYFPPFEPAYIKIGVSKHFIIPESDCLSYFGTKRPCNKSDWEY